MKIIRESLVEGAKKAKGLVVIIDVLRAFTTDAYIINNGAEKIILVSTIDNALKLKIDKPQYLLAGERNGIKIEGFDFGNSPAEIQNIDFKHKIIVQTTSAGTQGVVNARQADEIILGSFVCLNAIVGHIKRINPPVVTLVAMGKKGIEKTDEDELCAQAIENLLHGQSVNLDHIKNHLINYKSAVKFLDLLNTDFNENDFHLAMDFNRFDFILKVHIENKILYATKAI